MKRPRTILLIDDDTEEADLFQLAIEEAALPINLVFATEDQVEDALSSSKPDLIFLDINMPVYNGMHWLKNIREKTPKDVPIIMYSTTLDLNQVDIAYQAGANLFLTKPDTVSTLIKALKDILQIDWSQPRELIKDKHTQQPFHLVYP